VFPVILKFPNDYPSVPPHTSFAKPLYHVNVYPSGKICLSITNSDADGGA
jgi:ubiquitin-conjugating enzyme E2 I